MNRNNIHTALLNKLNALEAPEIRKGLVSFALFALISGGIGRNKSPNSSMVPKEWIEAGGDRLQNKR